MEITSSFFNEKERKAAKFDKWLDRIMAILGWSALVLFWAWVIYRMF